MDDQLNETNELLKSIYYNTANPGSFGGYERLYREAKKVNNNVSLNDVKNFLESQLVYTLHKQARKKFKRNPIIAENINENFQADLVDLREFSRFNNGFTYILTCIDVFSKIAWCKPLKNKNQESVAKAMEEIFTINKPFKLMTDKGKEFDNSTFKALMKKYSVNHFFAKNKEIKCSIVERFNKTLKNRMFKYFTLIGKRQYINELSNIVDSYNKSYHRSIKMAPIEVSRFNQSEVFKNLYGFENKREFLKKMKSPKLQLGVNVRKKYVLGPHERGYYPYWSDQVYKVHKSIKGKNKPQYILSDEEGGIIEKKFYPEEIQKIQKQPFRIEKIIKERKRRGLKEFFVKWLNYPESQNSWIPASNITEING